MKTCKNNNNNNNNIKKIDLSLPQIYIYEEQKNLNENIKQSNCVLFFIDFEFLRIFIGIRCENQR